VVEERVLRASRNLSGSSTTEIGALDGLIELGYVRRNEGYGHPLRPEYLITDDERGASALAGRVSASRARDTCSGRRPRATRRTPDTTAVDGVPRHLASAHRAYGSGPLDFGM
jgi:hypothetical protein